MRYSAAAGGFYPDYLAYAALPGDLILIEDAYHAELMAAQAAGKEIRPDKNGVPQAEDPAAPTPEALRGVMTLTFAQLLIGLVAEGWISEADGEGWLDGMLPAPVTALIAGLPADQRFAAKARAKRPSVVERLNPLVIGLAAVSKKTNADLDAFFAVYAAI